MQFGVIPTGMRRRAELRDHRSLSAPFPCPARPRVRLRVVLAGLSREGGQVSLVPITRLEWRDRKPALVAETLTPCCSRSGERQ